MDKGVKSSIPKPIPRITSQAVNGKKQSSYDPPSELRWALRKNDHTRTSAAEYHDFQRRLSSEQGMGSRESEQGQDTNHQSCVEGAQQKGDLQDGEEKSDYAESVSVRTAVRMFGGEAKIRKLPTPDRSLISSIDPESPDEEDAAGNSSSVMYPICGTISPLGRVKRSHSDDQISFVFGRPSISDSRRSVAKPAVKCRPSSPASDVIKRTYTKTSIGGTGFREKIRHQELTADQGLNNNNTMETFVVNTMKQNGVYCEQCNMCLADFERQALRLLYPDGPRGGVMIKTLNATEKIEEKLQVPANCQKLLKITHCEVCHASLKRLKKEAVAMVASNQQAPLETLSGIPSFIGTDYRSSKRGSATNDHTRNSRRHRIASQSTTSHVPIPTSCSEKYKDRPKPTILAQQQRKFDENDVRVFPHDVTTYSIGPSEQPQQYRNNADYYQSERKPLHADPYSVSANVPRHSQYAAQQLNPHANMQAMDPYQARVQCGHHDSHVSQGLPPPHGGQGPTPIHGGLGYNNAPNYYAMQYHYSMPGSNVHHAAAIEHPMYVKYGSPPPPLPGSPPPLSRVASPGSQHSAAASFFARAAQKMGKKKKRHHQQEPELPQFPTKYNEVIRVSPPPVPPCLLRAAGRLQQPGVGKVKVMLKICSHGNHGEQGQSCLSVDPRKKQVTVFDPSAIGITTSAHRRTPVAPKMFAFDAVFSPDDSQTEVCASSLTEIIQGVVGGADGCLFTYGYSRQGKSSTMLGSDNSAQTLGVLPCAISWLFRLINEQKEKTGARFSVRVSAVEVSGKNERLKDLLFDIAQTTECGQGTAPGVYLREDPICGTQLENQSELRAPTCERAAYYLDAALAARASDEEEGRSSHLLFTLHVYQYRIEKANQAGLPGVAGGRSRLHLIDLGSSSKSKDPDNVSLSLSALGNVIMALLNGQRHVPHRDSKVAQLLRDSLGNISCRTCMIAHVSSSVAHHNETLQVIQLAARIHRMRRRKTRFSSTSSDDSSTDDGRLRRPFPKFRMGTLREDALYTSAHSDPDFTSSSEQSCDTVIYVGANGQSLSDREITDNEGPPRSVPRTNPRLPRRPSGSRSSGDEGSNSDSGRSRSSSDFRYGRAALVNRDMYNVNRNLFPRGVSTSPRAGITSPRGVTTSPRVSGAVRDVSVVQSPPMSPSSVPRKIRTRAISNSQAEAEKSPRHTTKGEQWIDGPGATMYPETRTTGEQWIDGPQAFVVKQEVATTSENKHLYNPKMNAEEQWVDGPMEMIADKPREGRSTHAHGRADKRGSTHDFKTSHASRHQKAKSEQEKTTRDSTASVDSVSSMTAQGPDSRPASLHVDHKKEDESNESVKPFVRDWVEKHSAINEESVCENSNIGLFVNYGNQVIGTLESACRHKRQKAENTRKLSSSTQSPHQSPLQSPTSRRKVKTDNATSNLQKSQLPTSANPTKRVTEWLKSVSTEQIQPCRDSANDKNCDRCHSDDLSQGIEDINMAPCSSDGRPDEMAECHVGDISFDSSVDTNSEVTTNLVINRDSIYEMQMDEQLEETAEASNSVRDNDTFSNTSCQKENELSENEEPEDSRESSVPHSITVESIKTLVAEENQKIHLEQQYCDCKSCHVTDGENEKITPLAISKSFLLRKPDGASNPNLTNEFNYDGKLDVNFMRGEYIINNVHHVTTHNQEDYTVYKTPPGVHKTPEIVDNITTKAKPPLPNSRHLKSHSASPARTSKNKDISLSPKSTSSYSSRSSSIPVSSHTGRSKEKSIHPSGQSSVRSSSIPVTNSPSSSCTTRSTSSKSSKTSPASTRLPLFSGKALQTNKDVKARNKKDKESKLGNERIGMLTRSCSRGTDSDSGNDSGIVPGERKLLSPYCTVTKPRTPSHSSSGHGSDNSSTVSADLRSQLGVKDKLHGGTSSGYESMLRDSEGSGSSSAPDDSNSESSSDKRKTSKRRRSSTRRSKSVPARSSESPEHAGQCSGGKGTSPSPKAWVDTRQIQKIKEEPFEIKLYDVTDVERLQRRRAEEETKESKETRTERFNQSKVQDNNDPKENIVLENRNWSFDCKFLMCFCRSKNKRTDV